MQKPKYFKPKNKVKSVFNSQTREWVSMYQNWRWRKYRDEFIRVNSTCYACAAKSKVCDHIKPHKGDWTLFELTTNHLPLCESCHNYCTANFDRFDIPKTQEKIKWLTVSRSANGLIKKVFILNQEKYFPKIDRNT